MTTNKVEEFNLANAPMKGCYLIEANAGTGKTFSLVSLYLKFLFNGYEPSEIMAVTFTKAATRELSSRIKTSLEELLFFCCQSNRQDAFRKGLGGEVVYFAELYQTMKAPEQTHIRTILTKAVMHFSDHPLQTIDSFMLNFQQEHEFELGQFSEKTLIENEDDIIEQAYKDFIRSYLKDYRFLPEEEENRYFLRYLFDKEKLFPSSSFKSSDGLVGKYRDFFKQTNLIPFSSVSSSGALEFITLELPSPLPDLSELETDEHFQLIKVLRKNHIIFLHFFIDKMKEIITQKKERQNVYFYSDPTQLVNQYLKNKTTINSNYRAFLIDEFQDTNPAQYQVFKQIIAIQQGRFKKPVVAYFIGDPKQSIYRFRGANLETYFAAREVMHGTFSLTTNYRTHGDLLKKVNYLFIHPNLKQEEVNPFYHPALGFRSSAPSESIDKILKKKYPKLSPEFQCFVPDIKMTNKGLKPEKFKAEEFQDFFVNQLEDQLNSIYRESPELYKKVLSNTAILVNSNSEINSLKKKLSFKNIPTLVESQEKITNCEEFIFLKSLLKAVVYPTAKNIRSPLNWLEFQYRELPVVVFKQYLNLWKEKGFAAFIKVLTDDYQVEAVLLKQSERSHTNFFHLIDLILFLEEKTNSPLVLYQKIKSLSETDLIGFDTNLRYEAKSREAIHLLTMHKSKGLEYDFVYVLYPDKKNEINNKSLYLLNQTEKSEGVLMPPPYLEEDLGVELSKKRASIKEELSENLRKLYVALTRAKLQVYLYVGHACAEQEFETEETKKTKKEIKFANPATPLKSLPEFMAARDDFFDSEKITHLNSPLFTTINIKKYDLRKDEVNNINNPKNPNKNNISSVTELSEVASKYTEPKPIQNASYQTSFTTLSHYTNPTTTHSLDFPENNKDTSELEGIHEIRGGTTTGNFFHLLIEQWLDQSFTGGLGFEQVFDELVENNKEYSYFKDYKEQIKTLLEQLQKIKLFKQFCLEEFSNRELNSELHWKNELEFMLSLKQSESKVSQELKQYLQSSSTELYPGINQPLKTKKLSSKNSPINNSSSLGAVKGFIDLVVEKDDKYYILDWKTNVLGSGDEDYNVQALQQGIKSHHYHLQALIYLTGLERHLKKQLKDYSYKKNIGGIHYIFLRGLFNASSHGVIDLTPSEEEFNTFKQLFY